MCCRIVDTGYAGTFSRISQKNTKTLRNVIRKGQHPTCSCHVPCLAWLPGCVAACKTELTRLQLPGWSWWSCCSAACCCSAAAVCSLGLSCYNYTLGGAASGYYWLVLEITWITSHLMVATNPDHWQRWPLGAVPTPPCPQCPLSTVSAG